MEKASLFNKCPWNNWTSICGFLGGSVVKESAFNGGNSCSIPGLGRFPGKGDGNPLQYACLENPMDRGAWLFTVNEVLKSGTWLSDHFVVIESKRNV